MSLADVSSGGSCDLFGFLEGWALFEGWGFGLLTRAGLMLLVFCGFHNSNTLGKEKKYIENLKKLLYHQYLIGSKV